MSESLSKAERLRREYEKQLKEHNEYIKLNSEQSSSSGFKKILKNANNIADFRSQRLPSPMALAVESKEALNLTRNRNLRSDLHTEPISPRFQRPTTSTTEPRPISPKIVSFHENVMASNEIEGSIHSRHLVPDQVKMQTFGKQYQEKSFGARKNARIKHESFLNEFSRSRSRSRTKPIRKPEPTLSETNSQRLPAESHPKVPQINLDPRMLAGRLQAQHAMAASLQGKLQETPESLSVSVREHLLGSESSRRDSPVKR